MRRRTALSLALLASSLTTSADAADVAIGPAATGDGSGKDWSNRKAWSATPARGDTWYLAAGNYSGRAFAVADSGTDLITIKKAIASDHFTDAGWDSSMSAQAVFAGGVVFSTGYWVFDGQVPTDAHWDQNPADYGFKFADGLCNDVTVGQQNVDTSTYTIAHVSGRAYAGDPGGNNCPGGEKFFVETGCTGPESSGGEMDDVTVSHCLANGWQNAVSLDSAGRPMKNWVIEHNVFLNGTSYTDAHGEDISESYGYIQNTTIRYNLFKGRAGGTAVIAVTLNYDGLDTYIYGNVFSHCNVGNGVIAIGSGGLSATGVRAYNNTFDTITGGAWLGPTASGYTFVDTVADNNLFYEMNAGGPPAGVTTDYGAYYSCSGNSGDAHIETGTGNPFVDDANDDYTLLANTTAGINLASPYDSDPHGHERTTWTRGAFEYCSGPGCDQPPDVDAGASDASAGADAGAASDAPADTGADAPADTGRSDVGGCSCSTSPGRATSTTTGLCVIGLALLRPFRRRRSARARDVEHTCGEPAPPRS